MQPSVLLDTSVFKALAAGQLEMASLSANLYVSPFCFWELLTHLEDTEQFARVKGNMLKFRHVTVLDDPRAEVERLVVQPSDSVHARVMDPDLIYAALAALCDSRSVDKFYSRFIRVGSGQIHQVEGCVSRARLCLQAEEDRFRALLRDIVLAVRDGRVHLAGVHDYDQGAQDLCRGWWRQIRTRTDETPLGYERFARKTGMYHCYLLHRAREYADRGNTEGIDPNDFEDARACLHVGLRDLTAVVTNDINMQRSLRATVETLNAMADAALHTALQVWDKVVFVSRLLPN